MIQLATTEINAIDSLTTNQSKLDANRAERKILASAFLGFVILGTGSVTPYIIGTSTSSSPALVIKKGIVLPRRRLELLTVSEQLIEIRTYLSLNVKELATALRVERATVYSWQRGANLKGENEGRLQQIYAISKRWRSICLEPLGCLVRQPLNDEGLTIVEMLSKEFINDADLLHSFELAKSAIEGKRNAIVSVRERKKQLGFAKRSEIRSAMALDQSTS